MIKTTPVPEAMASGKSWPIRLAMPLNRPAAMMAGIMGMKILAMVRRAFFMGLSFWPDFIAALFSCQLLSVDMPPGMPASTTKRSQTLRALPGPRTT